MTPIPTLYRLGTMGANARVGGQVSLPRPAFAGIATFLRAPQAELSAVPARAVAVSGVPLDPFGEPGGVREGPRGIREASVGFLASLLPSMQGSLVEVDTGHRMEFGPSMPLVDVGDLDLYGGPQAIIACLRGHAADLTRQAGLPAFLGGTRAISGPLLSGVAGAGGRKLAFLRISPSLDLREVPQDHALAPDASLLTVLNEQSGVASLGAYGLLPAAEWEEATHSGARITSLADWRAAGLAAAARSTAEELLREADGLYVSVDIRAVDGAFAAGRGRVASGGLLPGELLEVCEALAPLPLAAIDLVEVAPPFDSTRRAEHLAFRVLLALLAPRLGAAGVDAG